MYTNLFLIGFTSGFYTNQVTIVLTEMVSFANHITYNVYNTYHVITIFMEIDCNK